MTFADAEVRAAASVMGRLANASADFGAGGVSVIFDNGAAAVMQGMADAAVPLIRLLDADLAGRTKGAAVTVTYNAVATNYLLRNPMADGAGLSEVALELVTP
jgi:hypothetical protein